MKEKGRTWHVEGDGQWQVEVVVPERTMLVVRRVQYLAKIRAVSQLL